LDATVETAALIGCVARYPDDGFHILCLEFCCSDCTPLWISTTKKDVVSRLLLCELLDCFKPDALLAPVMSTIVDFNEAMLEQ
jgi:hypothetical protein